MDFFWKGLCLLLGYAFGIIETGMIFAKVTGIDLKNQGSGNTGATNTLRVAGKKAGLLVLLGDIIKCIVPMLIVYFVFKDRGVDVKGFQFYAGIGAILGHNFPFYAHFKGGKGVACTGALAYMLDPATAFVCMLIFIGICIGSGYVSLSSLIAVSLLYIGFLLHIFVFHWGFSTITSIEFIVLGALMVGLCFFQHRANIGRLLSGTENKLFHKKTKE